MDQSKQKLDVLIVGAGFSGMYLIYRMKQMGLKALVVEAAPEVGGTWYYNRYPGARCDVESMEYSYSFSEELEQEWDWPQKYSEQKDILEYANHVADRFDLRTYIKFSTKVISAKYDENINMWNIKTDIGVEYEARFFIMATGTLSVPNEPKFEGLNSFKGEWYMTGNWPHQEPDLEGKKVGIIGTGSSAIQAIPVIAKKAKHLTVFQRTPQYSIPGLNHDLTDDERKYFRDNYSEIRERARTQFGGIGLFKTPERNALDVTHEERIKEYTKRWENTGSPQDFGSSFKDIRTNMEANATASDFVRDKIREVVDDPIVAEMLVPEDPIWCKRLCVDTNYFQTYNRENVTLVDIKKTPIKSLVEKGLETSEDIYDLDVIVFAIGFDALTGAINAVDIEGKKGIKLKEKWADGPITYLGLAVNGFPNLFTITGPGSPSVLSNMMTSIEQHVDWVTDCIEHMINFGNVEIEAARDAEINWTDHVDETASKTVGYGCNSWYVGANVPGKKVVYMPYIGGVGTYREKCDEIALSGYKGFHLS